jgi:CENP-S protein
MFSSFIYIPEYDPGRPLTVSWMLDEASKRARPHFCGIHFPPAKTSRGTMDHEDASSLRAAIQYAILRTVGLTTNEEKEVASLDPNTASAIATLTELTLHYATQLLAPDLQHFCRHAGKSRITEQDVLLFIRRSPEHIQSQVRERLQDYADSSKKKDLKRLPPAAGIRPKPLPLNPKKRDDSSSDSSSTTAEVRAARKSLPKRTTIPTTKVLYEATSSEDEEMERIRSNLRRPRKQSLLSKGTSPQPIPKSRFRLPLAKAKENATGRRNDDSGSSEEEEFEGSKGFTTTSQNQRLLPTTTTTTTTTQQYIANLSQDSLLSENGL